MIRKKDRLKNCCPPNEFKHQLSCPIFYVINSHHSHDFQCNIVVIPWKYYTFMTCWNSNSLWNVLHCSFRQPFDDFTKITQIGQFLFIFNHFSLYWNLPANFYFWFQITSCLVSHILLTLTNESSIFSDDWDIKKKPYVHDEQDQVIRWHH